MLGLVSILPQPYYDKVEAIWDKLETEFNLFGFLVSPIPHFSWQIAERYDQEIVEKTLTEITHNIPPFQLRTNGIGLFTGARQVIHIPILKSCQMIKIHDQLWQAIKFYANELNPLYGPDLWTPHITLVHDNLNPENIGSIVNYLAAQMYNWEMTIDQIALVSDSPQDNNQLQFQASFKLGGY